MAKKKKCAGTNASGDPCKNPVVGAAGYCAAHGPGGLARMRELGLRGAIQSRKPGGLDPSLLGALDTHADALRWLREIGRAVVSGALPHQPARVGIQAVEAWVQTEAERLTATLVQELKAEVDELKRELRGPALRDRPVRV